MIWESDETDAAPVTAAAGAGAAGVADEESEDAVSEPEAPTKVAPVKEARSPIRKFVYLLVALAPFVAFVLLLPRGGEEEGGDEEPSPTPSALVTPRSVQLAFPYDFTQVVETPDPPEVVDMQEPTRQCNDGVDNDRDRRTDYPNDSGCSSSTDNSEANVVVRPSATPPPPPPPPPSPTPPPPPPPPTEDPDPPPPPDTDNDNDNDLDCNPPVPDIGCPDVGDTDDNDVDPTPLSEEVPNQD